MGIFDLNNLSKFPNIWNNPEALMRGIVDDPKFKRFLKDNEGKTPEQIAKENGVDFDRVKELMNGLGLR